MKKYLVFWGLILSLPSPGVFAQAAFEANSLYGNLQLVLDRGSTPIDVQIEYAVSDKVGLGGEFQFISRNRTTSYAVGGFANYHFAHFIGSDARFDPFVGFGLAKPFLSAGGQTESYSVQGGLQLGGRYFLTNRFGLMAQLSIGLVNASGSVFSLGGVFKFK